MHELIETGKVKENLADTETKKIREYMLKEAELQYRDYYETDKEEGEFFEYMDNMTYRDKLRLIEIFEGFTITNSQKKMASIPKRENNPELSVFSNLALDLIDFRDRVKPMADDMAMLDKSLKFQRDDP